MTKKRDGQARSVSPTTGDLLDGRLQRATLQSDYRRLMGPTTRRRRQRAKTIQRNGETLFVFGDASHHERRIQRAVLSKRDRLFWATIAIACGKPGSIAGRKPRNGAELAKTYGTLAKARNDLDAFYQYYRPMRLGDPHLVGVPPGIGKSPGYFDYTANLSNPTAEQLYAAIREVRAWLDINREDPEYQSFQLNFCFSGHGEMDDNGSGSVVLADGKLDGQQMVAAFADCFPQPIHESDECRLDLFLDCCHAGAVARSITRALPDRQPRIATSAGSLALGQVYCACLDDENAFELERLGHSVFTFAFLNECSRKRPPGAARTNLGLRDVGWYTGGRQHPLLLDFAESEGGINIKFPSSYYVRNPPRSYHGPRDLPAPPLDDTRFADDPVGELLRSARAQRTACLNVERELAQRPGLRKKFSRKEILTNTKFPFL